MWPPFPRTRTATWAGGSWRPTWTETARPTWCWAPPSRRAAAGSGAWWPPSTPAPADGMEVVCSVPASPPHSTSPRVSPAAAPLQALWGGVRDAPDDRETGIWARSKGQWLSLSLPVTEQGLCSRRDGLSVQHPRLWRELQRSLPAGSARPSKAGPGTGGVSEVIPTEAACPPSLPAFLLSSLPPSQSPSQPPSKPPSLLASGVRQGAACLAQTS